NTDDPQLYKFFREGDFAYELPLADGTYEVTLGFVEPDEDTSVGERVFNVTANGQPLLSDFDVVREAGADRTAVTRTFDVAVLGGRLTIAFTPLQGDAIVSFLAVRRSEGGA